MVCVATVLQAGTVLGREIASPERGQHVFAVCEACHSLKAGRNKFGPSLHGLFGRKAGTVPNYSYSSAMRRSGIVWDEKTLTEYLTNPHTFIPGDKMPFVGIRNPAKIRDLLAYLKKATK